jgi:phosphosulfolactate synthase
MNGGQQRDDAPFAFISGAPRSPKPRDTGLTVVADRGYGMRRLEDLVETAAAHIDWVKFAIGHWRVLPGSVLRAKIELLHAAGIQVFLAGDASEAAWLQGESDRYLAAVRALGADGVEISSAQVLMPLDAKLDLVARAADAGLAVVAEAGRKGSDPRPLLGGGILEEIEALRAAGPWRVLIQAEGITEGVEEPRRELIADIIDTFGHERLIFQAKDPATQEFYIRSFGPQVSLDVEDDQAVALELLRLGLRKTALAGLTRQEKAP